MPSVIVAVWCRGIHSSETIILINYWLRILRLLLSNNKTKIKRIKEKKKNYKTKKRKTKLQEGLLFLWLQGITSLKKIKISL